MLTPLNVKASVFLVFIVLISFAEANAQLHGFKFGQFNYDELKMKIYEADTSAAAVVLNEFGESFISEVNDEIRLTFIYHAKIKILKESGLDEANFVIPLRKSGVSEEVLKSVNASTFTIINSSASETKFEAKQVLVDKINKNWIYKKIILPNVRVGSVIEIEYEIESPFFYYNFHAWDFQSHLPKIKSEYWATIPGNYIYNMTLRGFLKLNKNESEIVNKCFSAYGTVADCARYKFSMENIPAFVKEEYMTAPSNFISSVNFQLSEERNFEGRTDKVAKEWSDVEDEFKRHEDFGMQLRKGAGPMADHIDPLVIGVTDELTKAKKIFNFIKDWFYWNENEGVVAEFGVRKAFENKKGNAGDINISLVIALRHAGLNVDPMVLSTRDNGSPIELHPVITDFDYVVAKLNIGEKVYLLDATDDYYPFGVLPKRCLNGKGRVLSATGSYWYDIKPTERRKQISMINLKLDEDGVLKGTVKNTYIGYGAINKRKEINSFTNHQDYISDFDNKWATGTVTKFTLNNVDDIDKSISEELEVEIEGFNDLKAPTLFLNPFLLERLDENPFKSKERMYPVDYGVPQEDVMVLTLELPPSLAVTESPKKVGLALPNNGGRYIYDVQVNGNNIVVNSSFLISRSIFSSEEYHFLKELYGRILQIQNADLVLKHNK
jgi:hypothetical protein